MKNSSTIIVSCQFIPFRCAKDIDTLIESLPNEDSSQELQAQSLNRLETENKEAAKRLEEVSGSPQMTCTSKNSQTKKT